MVGVVGAVLALVPAMKHLKMAAVVCTAVAGLFGIIGAASAFAGENCPDDMGDLISDDEETDTDGDVGDVKTGASPIIGFVAACGFFVGALVMFLDKEAASENKRDNDVSQISED